MGFSDAVLPETAKAQLKADSNPLPSVANLSRAPSAFFTTPEIK
jgi:hypothetical protein